MTIQEAIDALNAISGQDQGGDHGKADGILLQVVDPSVRDAYIRLQDRSEGWWYE